MKTRHLTLAALFAATTAAAPFAQAQESRADVVQQFNEARQLGMLPLNGEIAEPPRVLAARDAYNERQAEQIAALTAQRLADWAAYEEAERQRLAWLREQELIAQSSSSTVSGSSGTSVMSPGGLSEPMPAPTETTSPSTTR